jgi:hypothetical protein
MTTERLLCQHPLKSGLTLEFWDRSRPVAGDRWQVVLEARLAVAVTQAHLPENLQADLDDVSRMLGPQAVFSKEEVRHFVAAAAVPQLLQELQAMLLKSLQNYLGHPAFPAKFIGKKFAEAREQQRRYGR